MFGNPAPVRQQPPEERYASQLVRLEEMGFTDRQQNIRALTAAHGDVDAAVNLIVAESGE